MKRWPRRWFQSASFQDLIWRQGARRVGDCDTKVDFCVASKFYYLLVFVYRLLFF